MDLILLGVAAAIICVGLIIWSQLKDKDSVTNNVLDINDDGNVDVEDAKVAVKVVKHAATGAVGGAKATVTRAKRGRKPKN